MCGQSKAREAGQSHGLVAKVRLEPWLCTGLPLLGAPRCALGSVPMGWAEGLGSIRAQIVCYSSLLESEREWGGILVSTEESVTWGSSGARGHCLGVTGLPGLTLAARLLLTLHFEVWRRLQPV